MNLDRIYFGDIDPCLYSDIAERVAQDVNPEKNTKKSRVNRPSQLRRFYDELVLLHDKVQQKTASFSELHPFIQMLKAKVAYAQGRGVVDENYSTVLCHVVNSIKNESDLRQAKLFMEAFMAYYKLHGPSD